MPIEVRHDTSPGAVSVAQFATGRARGQRQMGKLYNDMFNQRRRADLYQQGLEQRQQTIDQRAAADQLEQEESDRKGVLEGSLEWNAQTDALFAKNTTDIITNEMSPSLSQKQIDEGTAGLYAQRRKIRPVRKTRAEKPLSPQEKLEAGIVTRDGIDTIQNPDGKWVPEPGQEVRREKIEKWQERTDEQYDRRIKAWAGRGKGETAEDIAKDFPLPAHPFPDAAPAAPAAPGGQPLAPAPDAAGGAAQAPAEGAMFTDPSSGEIYRFDQNTGRYFSMERGADGKLTHKLDAKGGFIIPDNDILPGLQPMGGGAQAPAQAPAAQGGAAQAPAQGGDTSFLPPPPGAPTGLPQDDPSAMAMGSDSLASLNQQQSSIDAEIEKIRSGGVPGLSRTTLGMTPEERRQLKQLEKQRETIVDERGRMAKSSESKITFSTARLAGLTASMKRIKKPQRNMTPKEISDMKRWQEQYKAEEQKLARILQELEQAIE